MVNKSWSAAPIAAFLFSIAAPVGSVATLAWSPASAWAQEATEETAEACRTRGIALLKEGKHEEAAAQLAKAIEIDPKDAYAHYYYGMVNSKLGKKDLMVKHYQAFLKLAPDAPEAPRVRALLKSL